MPLRFDTRKWTRRRFLEGGVLLGGAQLAGQFTSLRLLVGEFPLSAAELAKDPRRPQFHLLPAANWMNDPNGPIYWKGEYHMFFQYNPGGAYWGDMHWAHAVSSEMVHWRHLPVALSPTPGGADADGCFSGSAVVQDGVPTFVYTGVAAVPKEEATLSDGQHDFRETQCIATSSDPMLIVWEKAPAPVIATPPPGLKVAGFRDPCPWRLGEWWYLNVGSGVRGKGGMVLLYRSKDLRQWEYLHPLVEGTMPADADRAKSATDPVASGEMWECPDFFAIRDKYVLIYSTQGKVFWQSGALDQESLRFKAEQSGLLDHGSYYAPKTQLDKDGNRILWGWLPETRPLEEYRAAGWAGMMSLPRVLDLDAKGVLTMRFLPEVEKLRRQQERMKPGEAKEFGTLRIEGCCCEFRCAAQQGSKPFEVVLSLENGMKTGAELLRIEWKPEGQSLLVDGAKIETPGDETLDVNAFVDGSVIELLVNGRFAKTKRFYYPGNSAPNIQASYRGRQDQLKDLAVWQIAPISADRLTT